MFDASNLTKKWESVLDHSSLPAIKDQHKRAVTAVLLENTEKSVVAENVKGAGPIFEGPVPVNFMGASSSTSGTGGIDTFDPVMISLVRRSVPNLIAYDMCGVVPMTGPTGIIFAMRSRYTDQNGAETFFNEVNTQFSSVTTNANTFGQKHVGSLPNGANLAANGVYNTGTAMSRAQAEALGSTGNTDFAQMAFTIEKISVEAKSRALKAEYTSELAQDLKAVHGLDVRSELSNILQTEIVAEINREIIRTINITAVPGSQAGTTTAGVFDLDTDSNGRWAVEKWKGLVAQLDFEANQIAKATRRGKGNFILCSSDVATALYMAGVLVYTPTMATELNVDDTGQTFAGVINGRIKVYIDPYSAGGNYMTLGYKGSSYMDSGLFYCPYIALQQFTAVDPNLLSSYKIGFKTRYGMVANPYAQGIVKGNGAITPDTNQYFRRTQISNIM